MSYPQLTGRASPASQVSIGRPVLLAVLVLAAVLAGLAWRWLPRQAPQATAVAATPATSSTTTMTPAPTLVEHLSSEDQRLHLEHAHQTLVTAAEQLATARRLLAALSPELSRSYLQYEKRRADSAWTSCDVAARAIEEALDDIKVVATKGKD
jgi:hypothetical protein